MRRSPMTMGFTAFNPSDDAFAMRRRDVLLGLAGVLGLPQLGISFAMATPVMLTRPIPSSGEAMPVVGLGTSQVFDVGSDGASREKLREVLRLMIEAGGKIIDTSPMYGRAEAVTGDLLAESAARPRVFLATKVWTSRKEAGIA